MFLFASVYIITNLKNIVSMLAKCRETDAEAFLDLPIKLSCENNHFFDLFFAVPFLGKVEELLDGIEDIHYSDQIPWTRSIEIPTDIFSQKSPRRSKWRGLF